MSLRVIHLFAICNFFHSRVLMDNIAVAHLSRTSKLLQLLHTAKVKVMWQPVAIKSFFGNILQHTWVIWYLELTLPEYLNAETFVSLFRGNVTSLFTGVSGLAAIFLLLLLWVFKLSLPSVDDWFCDVVWDVRAEVVVVWLMEEEDEVELLPEAGEELNSAWVAGVEIAVACLVGGEVEVELLSSAREDFEATEVLPPTLDKLEVVAVFGAVDGKAGVLEVLCPADDDTFVMVACTGWAGSLLIFRFRKSLPYLTIAILKN